MNKTLAVALSGVEGVLGGEIVGTIQPVYYISLFRIVTMKTLYTTNIS
jgi:hypothetical protein